MEQRYTDRTVVVTGASGAIGEGLVRRFSAEGANVVLVARRTERMKQIAGTLPGRRTLVLTTDVTSQDDMQAMVAAAVDRFGGIDVLVSNAGSAVLKPFEETTLDDWRWTLDTDLTSCYLGAQAALPHLKRSRGSIIHTASASGLGGDVGMTAYNAAKGAMINFTRGLAFDLGPAGIRVNALAPALTATEEQLAALADSEMFGASGLLDRFADRRALAGHATPDDVAAAAAFLASDDARFITCRTLHVDGGQWAAAVPVGRRMRGRDRTRPRGSCRGPG